MIYVFWIAVVAATVYGIAKAISGERYSKMSEEEFEAEAKRSSMIGAGVAGLQKVIDPSHRVEYVEEQQQRIEADDAESGDRPKTGESEAPKPQDEH